MCCIGRYASGGRTGARLENGHLRDRKSEAHEWTKDPVCGMRLDRWTATPFASHRDKDHAFCSQRCRERFTAGPDAFVTDRAAEPAPV